MSSRDQSGVHPPHDAGSYSVEICPRPDRDGWTVYVHRDRDYAQIHYDTHAPLAVALAGVQGAILGDLEPNRKEEPR
jgi:hypothetical protein